MRILILSWLFSIPFLTNFLGIDMFLVSCQCQSDQQLLLLQMKNSFRFYPTSTKLMQWNQSTDCCDWNGVDCDEAGHVIGLDLSMASISGGIENATGLFGLQYLQSLNLASNRLYEVQVPPRLGNLTNLTYLNLSQASFAGQIPIEISSMTRLVTLDLSTPYCGGPVCLKLENPNLSSFLKNFTQLRELYLDGVNISASGNAWCESLSSSLPKLQVLSLSRCFLSGPIHPSLENLRSLSEIRLDSNNLSSPVPDFLADFSNLTSLYLSNCGLYGKFPEKIFQVPTLETLDLSYNELLQDYMPDFHQNLSLRRLFLRKTNFTGPIPTSIANLTQLVFLDFSYNLFSGPIPHLHVLKNLTHLDLSNNLLTGVISSTAWEQLLNLVFVDLSNNSLNGSIPLSLFELPILQQLQLADNQFDGQIHRFSNASSSAIDTLDLRGNKLEGPFPIWVFELKNLSSLDLSFNSFNGTVQLDKILCPINLEVLSLSYNSLTVKASSRNFVLTPMIRYLSLASCMMREIPDLGWLFHLFHLDLSNNQISGYIPSFIWSVSAYLGYLNLSHNLLVGFQEPYIMNLVDILDLRSNQLQGNIHHHLQIPGAHYVDYSSNNFTSSIPADIGNFFSSTVFFSAANNSLTGVIPESLCNASSLEVLDLSNNNLSGPIPLCLIKNISSLAVLNLGRNNLNGPVSAVTFPGNCSLRTLDLNGNQLEGMVSKSLANCKMLEVLDLGNNQFTNKFPCWLQQASSLHVLVLRSNNFSGSLGCPGNNNVSWPMLQIIDLASNKFNGRVSEKWLLNLEGMKMMVDKAKSRSEFKHLQYELMGGSSQLYQDTVTVTIKGLEIKLQKILTIFTSIDFSSNNFEGPIPEEMGLFNSLYGLNLSHNALTGSIPSAFENMTEIESLDLSMNNLSGAIPSELASLNFLSVLNLSYNHLVGKIPTGTQLQSFLPTSFEGNQGLCGPPLTNNCQTNSSEVPPSAPTSSDEMDWFFIIMATGFAVGFGAVVTPLTFSKKLNKWYGHLIYRILNRL